MNLAERLGYGAEERVLILNADDVGSTHASNAAVFECLAPHGSLTSGSVLVPSPWAREPALWAQEHPDADLGIHMTLCCEYTPYRWRPLTDRADGPHLRDADGGLWRTSQEVIDNVPAEEAALELRAQIESALALGIDVTHLDTHMGTVLQPKFIEAYVSLGLEYGIPLFIFRPNPERLKSTGFSAFWDGLEPQLRRLDDAGFPVLDHVITDTMGKSREFYLERFSTLRPGVTHFLVHPAKASEETEALGDNADLRAHDYEMFRDRSMAEEIDKLGIRTITYREVREAYRSGTLR
ncbi:MAG: polysaccharide deacetylase family protein [Dehalococcoidia bacterium]